VYITQEDEGDFIRGELLTQYPELKSDPEVAKRIRIISTAVKGPNLTLKASRKYLMRIPLKSAGDSGANRPLIPGQSGRGRSEATLEFFH
jgi:hypothetical protein